MRPARVATLRANDVDDARAAASGQAPTRAPGEARVTALLRSPAGRRALRSADVTRRPRRVTAPHLAGFVACFLTPRAL